MYPETDLPLLKISKEMINDVKKSLPKLRSELKKEFKMYGLKDDMIKLLFKQNKVEEFREFFDIIDNPQLISKVILIFPKEIAKRSKVSLDKVEKIIEDNLGDVLILIKRRELKEAHIKEVLENLVNGKSLEEATKFEKVDNKEVEEQIHNIIKSKPGLSENAYMGLVMKEMKGKISGK